MTAATATAQPAGRAPVAKYLATATLPVVIVICGLATAASPASKHGLPLVAVADVPLSGHATRVDYESIDPDRHLLFIAHLGDSAVIVFDTESQRVVARIEGVSKVHGVLVIPELGTVFASATGTNEVVAIDEASLKITARIPGGVYPDGMAYAPDVYKLYVSDEHGETDTVIDVRANARVATIPLGGEIGNTQYDPVSKHIFVNVQTRKQLIEIDPTTDKLVAQIDLPGAEGNHGLLIEPNQRRAFIACEGNAKLLVLDLEARKVTDSFDVGADPDVLDYDFGRHELYVAAESGIVSMFRVESGRTSRIGEAMLGPNAHVVAIDSATHKSYFPLMNVGGEPALRIMSPDASIDRP